MGGAPREAALQRCRANEAFHAPGEIETGARIHLLQAGVDARGKTPNGPLEERRPRNDPSALISAPFAAPFAFLPVRQQAQSNVAVAANASSQTASGRKKGAGSGAKGFVSSSTRLCIAPFST